MIVGSTPPASRFHSTLARVAYTAPPPQTATDAGETDPACPEGADMTAVERKQTPAHPHEVHEATPAEAAPEHGSLAAMTIGALGVVYGDIGTSPLYTFKTAIDWAGGQATPVVALGILSLVVWTLIITTSVKYVAIVMRADNDGEGGILALM